MMTSKWILRFLCGNYGGFNRTRVGSALVGCYSNEWRRDYRKIGRGESTKIEVDSIYLWDTLPRFQMEYW